MTPRLLPSPNFGYRNALGASGGRGIKGRHGHQVLAIVFHVFGGDFTKGAQDWFLRVGTAASYNDLILKNGDWLQVVDPFDPAWANGGVRNPTWTGLKYQPNGRLINPNLYTHSIAREGHSHEMTPDQVKTLHWVARFRAEQHRLQNEKTSFIGHNALDSVNRANCPGRGFNWAHFYAAMNFEPDYMEYIVVPGDSFWRIASRNRMSVSQLVAANPQVRDPAQITPGQRLRIPVL